jgi:hypothetical protein
MRSTQLRHATRAFAEQAAHMLATVCASGDEVGFEIVEQRVRGRGPSLYHYRPLIGEFVARNGRELARLETYLPAAHALALIPGLPAYLKARGVAQPPATARECADVAVRLLLEHVYEDAEPHFEFTEERFERAFETLRRTAIDGQIETLVVALLRGIVVRSPEVPLSDGVTLLQPEESELLPPQSGWLVGVDGEAPATLVVVSGGDQGGSAPQRLTRLLTALRLFGGGVAMDRLAWARTDGSAWRPLALDVRGAARAAIVIAPEQEDELRAFCSLVARRSAREGIIAWALRRFELGCEQDDPLVALSDHLLALRALLEPEGPRSGRLAGRLAALCALPPERAALAECVAHAISLEQTAIAGLASHDRDVEQLVDDLADHLCALLRDVLCGHLDADLVAVADTLIEQPAAVEDAEEMAHSDIEQPSDRLDEPEPETTTVAGDWPATDPYGGQLSA